MVAGRAALGCRTCWEGALAEDFGQSSVGDDPRTKKFYDASFFDEEREVPD